MSKAMTIGGMVVAIMVGLLFGIDLVTGLVFGDAGKLMNIGALIAAIILGYLSWNAFVEDQS